MALVAYSDSEGSDTETPVPAPKPTATAQIAATSKPTAPFQKTEARKIKVALPTLKAEADKQAQDEADPPPAKRARTAGAFGGFNSLLPAPKRTAAQATGLKKGVSLKTSSEAAFSRVAGPGPAAVADDGAGYGAQEDEVYDEFGNSSKPQASGPVAAVDEGKGEKEEVEVKVVGKSTRFKPLSVANNRKKKVVKKFLAAPAEGRIERDDAQKPPPEDTMRLQEAAVPVAKPKRSLFTVQQEEEEEETLPEPADRNAYTALDAPDSAHEHDIHPTSTHPPAPATAPAPPPNFLQSLAADMNLTPTQRRQLFGRHATKDLPATINLTHFNTDAEYAANEAIRQSGETMEHRAVKTVAPGKHSLQQLVNNARTNQDSIEDKWAEGRRNRGDAGSKYGWGK
ncbi:hypothetical protein B0A55_05561 [Friedmanniomyces simplex]|uniref:Uncharacterized protein n=1 Tax=Friedmanniomyces simplex TaxID=329884 RepID=A0A4U0XGJ9_9PEZI|nr:hypothetical protein B0A55_05561 [Friedmanniomyces simplex]